MTLQTNNLVMVALPMQDDATTKPHLAQPTLVDGMHLRWAFGPGKGFPWYGFYLFRREHHREDPQAVGQSLQGLPQGRMQTDTLQTAQGTFTSDASLVVTDDYHPPPPQTDAPELDLGARGFLRFSLDAANLAYWVEIQIYFRSDGEISITALYRDVPLAETRLGGAAGTLHTATLQADAIDAIELGSAPASLVDVRFVPVAANVNRGWEKVPGIAYPLTLPVIHPDYPPSAGALENLNAARQIALTPDRIVYGDPALVVPAAVPFQTLGTVTIDAASPIVEGQGTNWTDTLIGGMLQIPGDPTAYLVMTVLSETKLVLSRPYVGAGGSGLAYTISHDPFGQLHDSLVHLVRGGPASIQMEKRFLPLSVTSQGTVDVAEASTSVQGTGTGWTASLAGLYLTVEGEPRDYYIVRVDSATQLTVEPAYVGATGAGKRYSIAARLGPAGPEGSTPHLARQSPLELAQIAALHPAAAQILGLYAVDRSLLSGTAYDYVIVAAHEPLVSGASTGDAGQDALDWIRQRGLDDPAADAFIVYNRQIGPAAPLEKPIGLAAYALPTAGFVEPGAAGLHWDLGQNPDQILLPAQPVMYHVWRADLGSNEPAAPPGTYHLLTSNRPVLVVHSDPPGKKIETRNDWPPIHLHYVDWGLAEGWYSYQVCGIDLFGRYSPNSDAAPWKEWSPTPDPRPWYWGRPTAPTVHPFAVGLLDKIPPPPPIGVEAFTLDPADPLLVKDTAYTLWWNALTTSAWYQNLSETAKKNLTGVRVRWLWTEAEMHQAPDTAEFRIYFQPGPLNAVLGRITAVKPVANQPDQSLVETDIANSQAANAFVGASLRIGTDAFEILGSNAGSPLVLTVKSGPVITVGQATLKEASPIVVGKNTNTAWKVGHTGLTFRVAGEAREYRVLKVVEAAQEITLGASYRGLSGDKTYILSGKLPQAARPCSVVITAGPAAANTLFADYYAAAAWRDRFRVVDYDDHMSLLVHAARDRNGLTLHGTDATVNTNTVTLQDLPVEADLSNLDQADSELVKQSLAGRTRLRPLCLSLANATNPNQHYRVLAIDPQNKKLTLDGAPSLTGSSSPWVLGLAARRYEIFLPDPSDASPAGLPLVPSLAEPIVYGSIGVSAADDKAHTPDDTKWQRTPWGDRPGNEGQVSAPVAVYRVRRERPDPPVLPAFEADKLYATRANYHSHSLYTVRWMPAQHLRTHIFRALDEALYQVDWLIRSTRSALDPANPTHAPCFPDNLSALQRQAAVQQLNALAARSDYNGLSVDTREVLARLPGNAGVRAAVELDERDWEIRRSRTGLGPGDKYLPPEWTPNPDTPQMQQKRQDAANRLNAIVSAAGYANLTDDARRVLANLPGNELAFSQLTVAPLDPDDTATANGRGPDDPDSFTMDDPAYASSSSTLRRHVDTLDGRSSNAYFYRVAVVDGAQNRSALSQSTPPVYCPDVTPPRAPVLLQAGAGPRMITLRWLVNDEPDLARYLLYCTASVEATRDLRLMDLVLQIAKSPQELLRTGEVAPLPVMDAAGQSVPRQLSINHSVPAGQTFHYLLVAVDVNGNSSEPSAAVAGRAYQPAPAPPSLAAPIWDAAHEAIMLSWSSPDANLRSRVERREPSQLVWVTVSDWLAWGVYEFIDRPPNPSGTYEYRIKVSDRLGQRNQTYQSRITP